MSPDPIPPRGVRLMLPDRGTAPLECVYLGRDARGIHQWRAVLSVHLADPLAKLVCDALPPQTGVTVEVIGPPARSPR